MGAVTIEPKTAQEECDRAIAREREWAKTEIGVLFVKYESALGNAWNTDANPNASDRRLREVWDRSNAHRANFLTALRGF